MIAFICAETGLAASGSADRALDHLFVADWEWRLNEYPEFATALGDHRFDDKLAEISSAAAERRRNHRQTLDHELRKIDRENLSQESRLSLDIFRWQLDEALAFDALYRQQGITEDWNAINHLEGAHVGFASTIAVTRFERVEDYRNYISRLGALANRLDQAVATSRSAMKQGWLLPRVTVDRVPEQIDRIVGRDTESCSWYAPLRQLPAAIDPAVAGELRNAARQMLEERALPALRRYRDHVVTEYLPRARTTIAATDLPAGPDYYRLFVRSMTSLPLEPDEIHRIGLAEVARIRSRMEAIAHKQGFRGTLTDFIAALRARPDQYYGSPEALLDGYRAIGKRADPLMSQLFHTLPRAAWGVRAATPEEQGNADHYLPAAADGSRAGYFVVDTSRPAARPKYEMTALVLHEAVPGHHLQTARAVELDKLPDFRRHGWFTAYGEGWALYAESLGEELGLYRDDFELLGRYSFEIFRAARLVVDTGMHVKGWSRQQAIDYLRQATGGDLVDITAEIDRYIVWPGQALAYKMGEIAIRRLRERASASLGPRFDLRAFHSLVLDAGTLPLALLEARIEAWIAAELGHPASIPR